MKVLLHTISAFTFLGKGGNLAGVVLNADSLSDQKKQKIANRAGYSETAFVTGNVKIGFNVFFLLQQKKSNFVAMRLLQYFICYLSKQL